MAHLDKANLNLIEPFVGQTFSELQGQIEGDLTLGGSLRQPKLNGSIDLTGGQFRVNYLNTVYDYDGPVQFTDNSIRVTNGQLFDQDGNVATISGGLLHSDSKTWNWTCRET